MKNILKITLLAAIVGGAATAPAFGQRQELIQLQADIIRLTQQVSELQRSTNERNAVVQSLVEQMSDRMMSLSETVARIANAVEAVRAGNEVVSGELRVTMSSLREDLGALERHVEDMRGDVGAMSRQMTGLSTGVTSLGALDDAFRLAQADLLAGNYDLAINGFQEFIDLNPNNPRVAEAQLYLGDAYYNQRAYDQAIIEYDLLLQKYPNSDKKVTALYKKGLALAALNQTQNALTFLRQVVAEFPDSTEAASAEQRILELGGGR